MPKADLSFLECLPLSKTNNNNFFSFIDPDHILAHYGGRFLIFTKRGSFVGEVLFDGAKEIKPSRLHLRAVSNNMEFYIFEGPEFKPEEPKEKKKKDPLDRGMTPRGRQGTVKK